MAESTTTEANAEDIETLSEATVCTVDELNADIASVIDTAVDLHFDYVVGEVTDHRDVNGHVHFDLDYEDASLHCIVFSYKRSETTDDLEESTQVAVAGDLSYYEPSGSCSILVSHIVELSDGRYQEEYQKYKQALEDEGLLDDEHKQPLPELPRTVGIVTSADSDAREDAVTSIHERHPDVDIFVHHASVQGKQALPTLLEAISALDRDPEIELIVVTRGGGADTTLRVFNEPGLCRAIFRTETPIVVGIGNERDQTLAEEVADHRVMRPTHVDSTVPEKEGLIDAHDTAAESLDRAYRRMVERRLEESAQALADAYTDRVTSVVSDAERRLDSALEAIARERLTEIDQRLDHALESIEREQEFEREKEAATREVEEAYVRRDRLQRMAIILLLVLLLGLMAYILLGL